MQRFLFILFFIVSGASFAQAADLPIKNAGFVPANIWYSKDPFFAGETVRVYTIIFNGSTYDLRGGVEFSDNGTVIGKTNFSLAGSGRVQDVWVDWKAGQGAHTITARLVNVIAVGPNGKQTVLLDNKETGMSNRVVDVDPVILTAQSEAQAQKVADVKNKALEKVGGVIDTVKEYVPTPVRESVSAGASTLESFRVREGHQIQIAKEKKAREIETMKIREVATATATATTTTTPILATSTSTTKNSPRVLDTVSNAAEKPFAYVMLALLTLLQYFFEWKILFYGISIYLIYRLIKWIVGKIRNR